MAEWSDYRYFLALARAGTLAAAARDLGVEHTTVSRRIAALETALGTKLFVRTPDGFVLTAAGSSTLPRIEEAAKAIEAVEMKVAGEDAELRGTVRVTASHAIAGFLMKRLAPFRQRHPEIVIEFLTGNQMFDLARREADLALRVTASLSGDLIARKVGEAGWGVFATAHYLATHPRVEDGLPGHEIISYDTPHAVYPGQQWLDANARKATTVMRGNDIVSVLNAVLTGAGAGTVPCFIGDAEKTLARVVPHVIASRPIGLVVHPDLAKVARVRATMDFLIELATAEAKLLAG
ncbi:MAG TPA: LysR family transcriptional regulator [Kofleriaceae bacterium]|nr:LysR family transcriptional regulator [Kofleriaceae bacterium]